MTKSKSRLLASLINSDGDVKLEALDNTAPGTVSYDTLDSLPVSGLSAGNTAFVDENRRLYISDGNGWYNTALVNRGPRWDSGGEPDASYSIADSATPLVITAKAIDSDNVNFINQSTVTDSAQYMVDITNDSSVFTFTPKSVDSIGEEVLAGNLQESSGDFVYTFKWSDGISFVSKAVTISYNTAGSLYDFTSHTFSPANTTGRVGPSISTLRTFYDVSWGDDYLNEGDFAGFQEWTVPATGSYTITAAGAAGHTTIDGARTQLGGSGAIVRTTFDLTAGDVITIVAGQNGGGTMLSAGNGAGGGGGGSFVWSGTNTLMLAAGGGGGGAHWTNQLAGQSGRYVTSGGAGAGGSGASGGTNGNGGSAATMDRSSGAGAGWLSNGATHPQVSNMSGYSKASGFVGGQKWNDYAGWGGFGGGGGSYDTVGGAGGGYSGGGAGGHSGGGNVGVGGGGGSYSSGTLIQVGYNAAPATHGVGANGYVTIAKQ